MTARKHLSEHGIHWTLDVGASTDAVLWPVTVKDLRSHLYIDTADDDELLEEYLAAATETIKKRIRGGGSIEHQTITLTADRLPSGYDALVLPLPPLASVTSLTYYDGSNVQTVMPSSDYVVTTPTIYPGSIRPQADADWPATYTRRDAVVLVYTAGYGNQRSDIPPQIRQAVRLSAGQMYRDRDGCSDPAAERGLAERIDALLSTVSPGYYG